MLLLLRTSSSNVREAPSGVLGAGKRQQRHRELFLLIPGCRCLPAKPCLPSGCVLSAQRVLGLAALCREWVRCAQTLTVEGREGREAVREGRPTYTAPAPHAPGGKSADTCAASCTMQDAHHMSTGDPSLDTRPMPLHACRIEARVLRSSHGLIGHGAIDRPLNPPHGWATRSSRW
jgi:hypothetical protein